ncbi:MAG: 5-methyltetrahydrofolate--homocysteine methyltransferase [Bacteroidaceae bacterium]|nr:5-methyltetrahydrofolate--homocysteine methyltransferase [Bacteroidaceae bacterium]
MYNNVHDVAGYINWLYFFHAWGFPVRYGSIARVHGCVACRQNWLQGFPGGERVRAGEAMRLYDEARNLLDEWDRAGLQTRFRVALRPAVSDGDDILLPDDGERICLLRQQHVPQGEPCLCLADFVRPIGQGEPDRIGLFATTVDREMEQWGGEDEYRRLLSQTLADRLAEATAEAGHLLVRRRLWGYAPDEDLTVDELFAERYQGRRPAVGYPSLPDQSLNFQLARLLDFDGLGIRLTENGAMQPHASTSGLMISHPQARHFSVGTIGEDQLQDYARRRGASPDALRRFLQVGSPA